MVAARLLGIPFSMTLHGSDLLLHGVYLDLKLKNCAFCVTVSEFNRRFALGNYPKIEPGKIVVQRIGVNPPDNVISPVSMALAPKPLMLLACLGRQQLDAWYTICDLVVLTSRSEGIPLVLMEAMAHAKTVLAPDITGIPELVKDGETGFLYRPGSLDDFVAKIEMIRNAQPGMARLRRAARQHVLDHFHREKNLAALADLLVSRIARNMEHDSHENPILQQI